MSALSLIRARALMLMDRPVVPMPVLAGKAGPA
jgi:hypothetical protein